jgi:hypothetical protein
MPVHDLYKTTVVLEISGYVGLRRINNLSVFSGPWGFKSPSPHHIKSIR